MALFRRKKLVEAGPPDAAEHEGALEDRAAPAELEDPVHPQAAPAGRGSSGPYDSDEVQDLGESDRVDLGGMLLPGLDGMELRVDLEEETGRVGAVSVLLGDSALQVMPFAAPRRAGIWAEVRTELAAGITRQGGTATVTDGPFGEELRARVPVGRPDGSSGAQPVRFIGVDGPRWFLRGVLSGSAYDDPQAAAPLEELFRGIIVVRGAEAMAPRQPLPLTLPTGPVTRTEAEPGSEELTPFERGPEITEIR